MESLLPVLIGGICAILALIGLRELLKELAAAAAPKVG